MRRREASDRRRPTNPPPRVPLSKENMKRAQAAVPTTALRPLSSNLFDQLVHQGKIPKQQHFPIIFTSHEG